MRTKERFLLTGITGTVGSWLAAEALQRNLQVIALVRAKSLEHARCRAAAALEIAGAGKLRDNLEVVTGDITERDLGLDPDSAVFHDLSGIVHSAACISFYEPMSELIYQTNVEGTRHVLDLASTWQTPVVHVSTAYVAGKRQGVVRENDLDVGQAFNNSYEKSKVQAEGLVCQWQNATGLPATILRPGIVLGDSTTGRTARFGTLYDFMHAFERLAPRLGTDEIRVTGQPEVTKNFIPVDFLARAAWHIILHGPSGTYHLTHPNPVTMTELRNMFSRLFGVGSIRLVDQSDFTRRKATQAERLYRKATDIYSPYVQAEPSFDRTNSDAVLSGVSLNIPDVDFPYLQLLLEYARAVDWGKGPAKPSQLSSGIMNYFRCFLAGKLQQQLLPDMRKLNADFRIILDDVPETCWALSIIRGALVSISHNASPSDCAFVLNSPTLTEIIAGRLSPQQAFFARRIEIKGDIETGLKLATRLAAFFKLYPYEVKDC